MNNQEELEEIDYSYPIIGKMKLTYVFLIIFSFGFISYFPFMYSLKSLIKNQLRSIPNCSVSYDDITLELFMPKVIVTNIKIPRRCISATSPNIKIKDLSLYFRGMSFSPFGPHFKLVTNLSDIPLESYVTIGPSEIAVNLRENVIDLAKLNKIIPDFSLSGKVTIDALVKTSNFKLSDLKVNIRSKDLTLPGQSIRGFKLNTMRLNNLLLKANMVKQKVKVEDFILGDEQADIRANFKGDIKLNQRNIITSVLNLSGEVAFSNKFLDDYSIIKLVMNKFDKKDDFYQIKLGGTFSNPKPSSLR